jgi:ATP-dependent DNA helicase DinG
LSVTSSECPGATSCAFGETCYGENARRIAAASDVIVVNQHLYASHIASGRYVLPEHDAVVFDEAHELEDILASSLGITVSTTDLAQVASRARRVLFVDQADVERCDALDSDALKLSTLLSGRLSETINLGSEGRLQALLIAIGERLARINSSLKAADVDGDRQALKLRTFGLATACQEAIVSTLSPTGAIVTWVSGSAHAPTLVTSPLDISTILTNKLWPHVASAVLTSATLSAVTVERLGLDSTKIYRSVESPFNYRDNALLYVARDLPDPRQPEWIAAAVAEATALIEAAGGRSLVLCTSHTNVERFTTDLRKMLKTPVIAQDDLPRMALLDAFAADPATTLVATTSFWQGVDVPGDSCICVIIDKIPFARPDDPLTAARRDYVGSQAFKLVDLPRAATLLAQGAGRLIRTTQDRGVVAVLDRRLATAGYRQSLLEIVPPMKRSVSRDEAVARLTEIVTTD